MYIYFVVVENIYLDISFIIRYIIYTLIINNNNSIMFVCVCVCMCSAQCMRMCLCMCMWVWLCECVVCCNVK